MLSKLSFFFKSLISFDSNTLISLLIISIADYICLSDVVTFIKAVKH